MATSDEVLVWTGFSLSTTASIVYYLASYYFLLPAFYNETLAANTSTYFDPRFYKLQSTEVKHLKNVAKDMFQFGYDNYMKYAYPLDELDPIHCTGRGRDAENRDNININDVLGDYMLTLVDSLDTLAVMGNTSEFKLAVLRVIDNLSFNKNSEVQVFEANIRILGSLLSAHLLIIDKCKTFGDLTPEGYDNELLSLASDLAARLLPAFSRTHTGIPFPRVNLNHGTDASHCKYCINETCSAGAGTLLLEFGVLSALLNDPVYYLSASRAVRSLYEHRSRSTGLIGNVIDIQSGVWTGTMSGIGAGLDSVYEYLIKSAIMFGDQNQFNMFEELYESIGFFLRRGRDSCDSGFGHHPIYVNVDMSTGNIANNWIDSLSAAWPGIQLLNGDLEEAICGHLLYYSIWRKYGALPERFNYNTLKPEISFYPLRPELVESTYLLYRATRSPFYLHVGKSIMESLNNHTKVRCGYATIHDVEDKTLEDRMESFFLSETCKYLYLLFDDDNPLHRSSNTYMFSTEGHIFPIKHQFRETVASLLDEDLDTYFNNNMTRSCKKPHIKGNMPIQQKYILQMEEALNIKL